MRAARAPFVVLAREAASAGMSSPALALLPVVLPRATTASAAAAVVVVRRPRVDQRLQHALRPLALRDVERRLAVVVGDVEADRLQRLGRRRCS